MAKGQIASFPKQWEFIDSNAKFPLAIAGTGGGKTKAGAIRAWNYVCKNPPTFGMVTAPVFDTLFTATIPCYLEIFPDEMLAAPYNKSDKTLRLKNGHTIFFRTTDDPDNLRGPSLGWFHMDEAAYSKELAFKVLIARLRDGNNLTGWLTTTPNGFNWLWKKWVQNAGKDYALYHWSARDNPFLPEGYIETLEQDYHDEFAMQEIDGEFVVVGDSCFFKPMTIKQHINRVVEPLEQYRSTKIWKYPVAGHHYSSGIDVSKGVGKDRATCYIVDCVTGEYVVEINSAEMPEGTFAYECHEIFTQTKWGAPYMPFWAAEEGGGYGQLFIDKMFQYNYPSRLIYSTGSERNPKWGWNPNGGRKAEIMNHFEEAVRLGMATIYQKDLLDEMGSFIRIPSETSDKERLSAHEGAHDDRVMAAAMAWNMVQHAKPKHMKPIPAIRLMENK